MTEDRVLEVESLRKDFDGGRGRVVRAVDDVSLSIERGEVVGLALSLRPSLLVADEPVSALDVAVQASILNLLRDLQGELGFACMLITDDLSTVEYLCDRVVVMYLGRVLEMGTRDRVFSQPTHPYTRSLLSAAPVPDFAAAQLRPQRAGGRAALARRPAHGLPLAHALPTRARGRRARRRGDAGAARPPRRRAPGGCHLVADDGEPPRVAGSATTA